MGPEGVGDIAAPRDRDGLAGPDQDDFVAEVPRFGGGTAAAVELFCDRFGSQLIHGGDYRFCC
jgi:hypothetical protein